MSLARATSPAWGLPLAFAAACDAADGGPEVVATTSVAETVPTVITVAWETEGASRGKVEFGVVGEATRSTPAESAPTRTHSRTLLGLPVASDIEFTVSDDAGTMGEPQQITTGGLPGDWSTFITEGQSTWSGFAVLGVAGASADLMVIDNQGRPVWWWTDVAAEDQVIRAFPSADGTGMVASFGGTHLGEAATIAVSDWFAATATSVPVDDFSHDFVQREDGDFAALTFSVHTDDTGAECIADGITEFDLAGASERVWDAWDTYAGVTAPCSSYAEGWSHANALDWDSDLGQYTIGMRNFATIAALDRATRAEVWSVGEYGSIPFANPDDGFIGQHQFERLDDGNLLVFDNGSTNGKSSRVMELQLDSGTGVATTVWSYAPEPEVYVYALGDVQRLPNGNTLIDWSTSGRLEEVSPAGETVWQLDVALGAEFGYMRVFDSFYPDEPQG